MLSAEEHTRWGYLETRVDRSAEEEQELRELRQRFYEQVKGKSDADFDVLQDASGSGSATPMSERAKLQLTATAVPRDRDQFENYIKQLAGGPFKPGFGLSGAESGRVNLRKQGGASNSPHNENRVVWATRRGLGKGTPLADANLPDES